MNIVKTFSIILLISLSALSSANTSCVAFYVGIKRPALISEKAWIRIGERMRNLALAGYITQKDFLNPRAQIATSEKTGRSILVIESETGYPYFFSLSGNIKKTPDTRLLQGRLSLFNLNDTLTLQDGRKLIVETDLDTGEGSIWNLSGNRADLSEFSYGNLHLTFKLDSVELEQLAAERGTFEVLTGDRHALGPNVKINVNSLMKATWPK